MIIKVKVKPNSGKQNIELISENNYLANLKSIPENNKANVELCKLLQRYFKREVRIKRGLNTKNKIVEVLE
ncbi:DUF167 domain-containing protein [Candidatus Pacearchaeota archaeon]|nr:DUF167 domain-containing protein [Candidatus Pacearchaeota archaeon]